MGGEDQGVEVEVVVVVSGEGGEGVVGEVSSNRMQAEGEAVDVDSNGRLRTGQRAWKMALPKAAWFPPDRDGRHENCLRLRSLVSTW